MKIYYIGFACIVALTLLFITIGNKRSIDVEGDTVIPTTKVYLNNVEMDTKEVVTYNGEVILDESDKETIIKEIVTNGYVSISLDLGADAGEVTVYLYHDDNLIEETTTDGVFNLTEVITRSGYHEMVLNVNYTDKEIYKVVTFEVDVSIVNAEK